MLRDRPGRRVPGCGREPSIAAPGGPARATRIVKPAEISPSASGTRRGTFITSPPLHQTSRRTLSGARMHNA